MLVIAFVVERTRTVTRACLGAVVSALHQGVTERTGRTSSRRRPTWRVSVCIQYSHCSERGLSLRSKKEKNRTTCQNAKCTSRRRSRFLFNFAVGLFFECFHRKSSFGFKFYRYDLSHVQIQRQAGRPARSPLPCMPRGVRR